MVNPVSEGLFPGRIRYKDIPFPQSILTLMPAFKKAVPEGDWMNWGAVEKWIGEVVGKI
jgi:hypothetical protein